MSDFQIKLDRLAELAVRFGVNVQPDQEVVLTAPIEAVELVRNITRRAYQAGAKSVVPVYADEAMEMARFEKGPDAAFDHAPAWLYNGMAEACENGAARLALYGSTPSLLAQQDPDKVGRANKARSVAYQPFSKIISENRINWNIIPFVTEGWAKDVFPDLPADEAVAKLWEHVFAVTRADQPDPVAAWEENFAELRRRMKVMQGHGFDALHFSGGGTDLTLGLAKGHVWVGANLTPKNGAVCAPNIPTEEIFTMPDRNRAEGRAVFTKPAVVAGSLVEGLVVEFKGGKAVSVKADKGQTVMEKYLDTDEGARHLGEVALVSNSSPVSKSGVLFMNTLLDENAACHIAFGRAYEANLEAGADKEAAGMNDSLIHHDTMIGSGQLDVDGVAHGGERIAVMRDGEFVI